MRDSMFRAWVWFSPKRVVWVMRSWAGLVKEPSLKECMHRFSNLSMGDGVMTNYVTIVMYLVS